MYNIYKYFSKIKSKWLTNYEKRKIMVISYQCIAIYTLYRL